VSIDDTMTRPQGRRAFQIALAERLRTAAARRDDLLLAVEFGVSGHLLDLGDIAAIHSVPEIVPVPHTRIWFRGVVNLRGNLLAVVDLAAFPAGVPTALGRETRLITLASGFRCNAALLVSAVVGLRHAGQMQPAPSIAGMTAARPPWLHAARVDADGRHWLPLDVRALVKTSLFLEAGTAG